MTTQLSIGTLAAGFRNPQRGTCVQVTEHASISGRPAIPGTVISWPDAEGDDLSMPVGAGDPATAVDGPASFLAMREKRPNRVTRLTVDAAMLSVLAVMLLGLAGAVAKAGEQPNAAWAPRDPAALAAIGAGKVGVVDLQVVRIEAVATPAGTGKLASTASTN